MTKINIPQLPPIVGSVLHQINRFKVVVFLVVVTGVYGYILLQISTLSNAQPSAEQISSQASQIKAAHIDKAVVSQLERLKDNSVSVQTLFNNARNNPFQE
jgi:hypothetical protein